MKNKNFIYLTLVILLAVTVVIKVSPTSTTTNLIIPSHTYTLDADFDEGTLLGLEHDTVPDQLQLSKTKVTLPFIWVPNTQGTVSKVNTETGDELGRYWVSPDPNHPFFPGITADPSRTTIDLQGNCWVGCRDMGTVVKIGLFEAGIWDDRNGDGICQTSQDENNDGTIDGNELLPWGEDECVLFEVNLFQGNKGTHVPGSYPGPYDTQHWRTSPRGLAVDAENNLWAGTCPGTPAYLYSYPCTYHYINGETGLIEKEVVMSGHAAYGAIIDENGILWSSNRPTGTGVTSFIVRFNPATLNYEKIYLYPYTYTYGMGLDYLGHLFISGWSQSKLHRVNIDRLPGAPFPQPSEWTKWGPNTARGVVCTSDNDVWVASTDYDRVYRFDNDGNLKTSIIVGNGPTGVSVDGAGNIWVCNVNDDTIQRINTTTNTVDFTKSILGSNGHYSYSDMTGIVARTITTKLGTWTTTFDSEGENTPWGKISWTSDEPEGTFVMVQVRSSNDLSSWSAWETTENNVPLTTTPDGRYLQIKAILQILSGEVSPILYDLTVQIGYLPIAIDIKPGSDPNSINLNSQGLLPVAILGSCDFDVTDINPSTIEIGNVGVDSRGSAKSPKLAISYEDVNGDSYLDLVVFFNIPNLVEAGALVESTMSLTLVGSLFDGTLVRGTDSVRIVPP